MLVNYDGNEKKEIPARDLRLKLNVDSGYVSCHKFAKKVPRMCHYHDFTFAYKPQLHQKMLAIDRSRSVDSSRYSVFYLVPSELEVIRF